MSLLQLCQLAVTLHKGCQALARVVNRPDALFINGILDLRLVEVSLGDALYGGRGIHNFVGQNPCEALPRLHFVLCNQSVDLLSQVVQDRLQSPFAKE